MARKRLNTRFALILASVAGAVVIAGAGGVYLVQRHREDPKRFFGMAEFARQNGDFAGAYSAFSRAVHLSPPSAELQTQLAGIARLAGSQDPAMVGREVAELDRALELDPNYLPAIRGEMEFWWQATALQKGPTPYQKMESFAERVRKVDPTNYEASALQSASPVQQSLSGIDIPAESVDRGMAGLAKLVEKGPEKADAKGQEFNANLMRMLVNAHLKRVGDQMAAGHPEVAQQEIDAAAAVLANTLKAQPDNLAIHQRALLHYDTLRKVLPKAGDREMYDRKFKETLAHAVEIAKKDDPFYIDVNVTNAKEAARTDRAAAAALYKKLYDERPKSQAVRLEYASFLAGSNETRAQAIEILSLPADRAASSDSGALGSAQAFEAMMYRTELDLANARMAQARASTDPAAREALWRQILDAAGKMAEKRPSDPAPLVLRGRVELMQGKTVDAVASLRKAKVAYTSLIAKLGRQGGPDYLDALLALTDAYLSVDQTGPAKAELREVMAAAPKFTVGRMKLVDVLLKENDVNGAKAELQKGRELLDPTDAQGKSALEAHEAFLSSLLATDKTAPQRLDSLPTSNRGQQVLKARYAIQLHQYGIAANTLQQPFVADPKDVEVATLLVQSLQMDGRKDDAKAIVASARQASPKDVSLQILEAQLNGATKDEIEKIYKESLQGGDEFTREVALAQIDEADGRAEAAAGHWKRAAELRPKDRAVLDHGFQDALRTQDFARAEGLLPSLADANADQAHGALYRFRLALARGKNDEALRIARDMTTELPTFPVAWMALGEASAASGDWAAAYAAYTQAIDRKPEDMKATAAAVEAAYQLRKPEDAKRLIDAAASRVPNNEEVRRMAARYDLRYGDARKAVGEAESRLAGNDSPAALLELGRTYAQASAAMRDRGDGDGARGYASKALDAFGRALDALGDKAQPGDRLRMMATLADLASQTANPAAAEGTLKKAGEDPSLAKRWEPAMILAEYYRGIARPADAERYARESVSRGGTAVAPRIAAATLMGMFGKPDDALTLLDGAVPAGADAAAKAGEEDTLRRTRLDTLIQAGRYDKALPDVKGALEKDPRNVDLQNKLTHIYVHTNQMVEADRQVGLTLRQDPTNIPATFYRGVLELRRPNGDVNAAVRDFETVKAQGGPMQDDMRLALIEAYQRANKPDRAIAELASMLQGQPNNLPLRLQLATAQASARDLTSAIGTVDAGLALPGAAANPDLLVAKSRLLAQRGDADAAITAARQARDAAPNAPAVQVNYYAVLQQCQRWQTLLAESDVTVKSSASPEAVPAWLYVNRATARKNLNDVPGATAEFERAFLSAIAMKNDDAVQAVVIDMARVLGPAEAVKAAEAHVNERLSWRLLAAQLYQSQGKIDQALKTIQPALDGVDKLTPREQVQVLTVGGLYLVSPGPQQDYDRAAGLYLKLVALAPDDLAILNNLAYIMSEKASKPDLAGAAKYAKHAVDLIQASGQPQPLIYDTYGWILVLSNKPGEALPYLTQAVDRRDFLEGRYHLGLAFLKDGKPREAITELDRAKLLSDQPGADPMYRTKIVEALRQANDDLHKK